MSNFYATQTNANLDAKVANLAGRFFFDNALSGAGWNVLAMIVAELTASRVGDEAPGRFEARATLANASRLLALKPANYGA